jgi:hypothetical protein
MVIHKLPPIPPDLILLTVDGSLGNNDFVLCQMAQIKEARS